MPPQTVFLDVESLAAASADPGAEAAPQLLPDADSAIGHLVDAGHRVVLLGEPERAARIGRALAANPGTHQEAVPDDAEGWLVSDNPAVCSGVRRRRLHTILVGPTVQRRGLAHRPADMEARDLMAAVLAILAAEVMPDAGTKGQAQQGRPPAPRHVGPRTR